MMCITSIFIATWLQFQTQALARSNNMHAMILVQMQRVNLLTWRESQSSCSSSRMIPSMYYLVRTRTVFCCSVCHPAMCSISVYIFIRSINGSIEKIDEETRNRKGRPLSYIQKAYTSYVKYRIPDTRHIIWYQYSIIHQYPICTPFSYYMFDASALVPGT